MDSDKRLPERLWWNGPQYITQQIDYSLEAFELAQHDKYLYLSEFKSTLSMPVSESALLISECTNLFDEFLQLINNYVNLIRFLSYVFRFIRNIKQPKACEFK